MIVIELETDHVLPGATLRGQVRASPHEGVVARALSLEVGWRTEGRGSVDRGVVHTRRWEPTTDPPAWNELFEAVIPAEGPFSYDGRVLRIIWEVRAALDTPWAGDETAMPAEFRVSVRS